MSEQNTEVTTSSAVIDGVVAPIVGRTETSVAVKPVRTPALPAFNGQTEARVTSFKDFVGERGHKMEDFKGEAGKLLRMAENAAYEAYKAQFNTACAGALSMALASGEFTIIKATKNKSGHIAPVLVPVKKNSKQLAAIAYLESLGMKVVKGPVQITIEHKS